MSILIPKNPQHLAALDRRGFVLSAVAVGGGVAIGLPAWPALAQAQGQAHEVFNWVVIAPDNTVTLRVGQQEMGQGTITTMAQLL